uniref:Uncharacterized protein n=1 Tax=Panstrongylus lignarius TaxID=156445 RepID=A0A224XTE3_9HEMI
MDSCTLRNTVLSQKLFLLTMPFLSSLCFELNAMLNSIFLMTDELISDITLSYILFSSRGTAGVTVGLSAFISSDK